MATRMGFRYVSRRFLTSGTGKILSEEERAAENVFIKKMEQERLEKLARKGPKPERPDAGSGGSVTDAKPSSSTSTTGAFTEKVSTDRYRTDAVSAGVFTFGCGLGWYLSSKEKIKKYTSEVQCNQIWEVEHAMYSFPHALSRRGVEK